MAINLPNRVRAKFGALQGKEDAEICSALESFEQSDLDLLLARQAIAPIGRLHLDQTLLLEVVE